MDTVKKYIPLALLSLFVGKLLYFGANFSDVGVVFALAGLVTYKEHVEKNKMLQELQKKHEEDYTALKTAYEKDIFEIKSTVNLQNEVIQKQSDEIAKTRNHVDGMKLGFGMRKMG